MEELSSTLKLLLVFIVAISIGLILVLILQENNPLYGYAIWRAGGIVRRGMFGILINNIVVIALTLYGGIVFALLEIKSYNTLSPGFYNFLDKLAYPLHKIFSFFDRKIIGLENPLKSCYFLTVAFPVMVVFLNAMLLSNLILYAVIIQGFSMQIAAFILKILLIGFFEFFCILASAIIAYNFTQRNYQLYRENDINAFTEKSHRYLKSRRNFYLFVTFSVILTISAILEVKIIR